MATVRVRSGTEVSTRVRSVGTGFDGPTGDGGGYVTMRAPRAAVSRRDLFSVLCRAVDVLHDLPEEIREDFAGIIQDATACGWVPREPVSAGIDEAI